MKYDLPYNQHEVLPNLLGLSTAQQIAIAEFEGFVKAEIILTEALTLKTKFDSGYILNIHKLALEHLYTFAGKLRDVNMSKGGFPFPAARFLHQSMNTFDIEVLSQLPNKYNNKNDLITDIAIIHSELLFIHPFREGNGRTARLLANLMCRKQGYDALKLELITPDVFQTYVTAIQLAAEKHYGKMKDLITLIFPG